MSVLIKLILPFIKTFVLKELTKESNKTLVVKKLNDLIDIPELSESQEAEVIEKVYSSLEVIIKAYFEISKKEDNEV